MLFRIRREWEKTSPQKWFAIARTRIFTQRQKPSWRGARRPAAHNHAWNSYLITRGAQLKQILTSSEQGLSASGAVAQFLSEIGMKFHRKFRNEEN